MRPVGVLNFGNSSSLWPKAKRSCSQSYPQDLFASPTVWSTACTFVLDSLYSPSEMIPCHTDVALVCSRSILSDLLRQRFPSDSCWTSKTSKKQHFAIGRGRVRSVSCHTSCESVVHCHSAPIRSQATKRTRRRTPWMSELSSRLLKALLSESLPWRRTICPQQPNIFLTSNDDDVDQSWKQGSFQIHWFLSRMPSDQKNGGSALDAPRFAGRKDWPLKLFSSS